MLTDVIVVDKNLKSPLFHAIKNSLKNHNGVNEREIDVSFMNDV
jgi:hypothetical protein